MADGILDTIDEKIIQPAYRGVSEALRPDPGDATESERLSQKVKEDTGGLRVPPVQEVIGKGLKAITGGGIAKDEPTGTDEPYDYEIDPVTGDKKLLTTGDMAAQSIQEQLQPISEDEFRQRIIEGKIPGILSLSQGQLQAMIKAQTAPNVPQDAKDRFATQLNNAYRAYNTLQDKDKKVPVEFSLETAPGEYQFAPTEEAETNPRLKTIQKNISDAKSSVAMVVRGTFDGAADLTDEDRATLERVFVTNLSTGEFWDTLTEKINDGVIRGTAQLPNLVLNYGLHAVQAGLAAGTNFLNPSAPDKGFFEQWADTEDLRNNATRFWKERVLQDKFGIKDLSVVMNEMVVTELKRQVDSGTLDDAEFERLTKQTVRDAAGVERQIDRTFVNEEQAYSLLNNSIDQLSGKEQYAMLLAEAGTMLLGVNKAKAIQGRNMLDNVTGTLNKMKAKADEADPNTEDGLRIIKEYNIYKDMTPIEAGIALKQANLIKKFHEKNALYALGLERADANIKRLSKRRNQVSLQLKALRQRGVSQDSVEYKTLLLEKKDLTHETARKYMTGRFLPNVKESFKDAIPLAATMYYVGQSEMLNGWLGEDTMMKEGMGALVHLFIGKFAVTAAGKTAYWVNQQSGDQVNNVLKGLDHIANIPFKIVGKDVVKGFFASGRMDNFAEIYTRRTGRELPKETRVALNAMQRVAFALDDEGLDQVVNSMEKHQNRLNSIVDAFPLEEQNEIRGILQETVATTSSMGWLQSVERLQGVSIDYRDINSASNLAEQMNAQRHRVTRAGSTTRLVKLLREKSQNRTDIDNPKELENYINSLELANEAELKRLQDDRTQLASSIRNYKRAILEDPTSDIPPNILDGLDDMEIEIEISLKSDVDQLAILERQYQQNMQSLAVRAENVSSFRGNRGKHIKETARNLELVVQNKFARMRKRAKRGFIQLDIEADKMGKSIPVNSMITELMKYAPDSDIKEFFGKNSRFFSGTLGKRMYKVANKMAKRSLESMEGTSYDDLSALHTNKSSDMFIKENATSLDILLFYMDEANQAKFGIEPPSFLATPGEVMDVYSSFRDYAIRLGDDDLASRYEAYAGNVEDLVNKEAPEFFERWKDAREIYQEEWFDKLRVGGPLQKLHKSQVGPVKVSGKKATDAEGDEIDTETYIDAANEEFFFEDVAVGEVIPEGMASDRLFRFAYKGETPLDAFDKLGINIEAALRGDRDAMQKFILNRSQFVESFSDGAGDVFDLTQPNARADFDLLRAHMTEMIYSKWGYRVADMMKDTRLSPGKTVIEAGGYNFAKLEGLAEVQDQLTVMVKMDDGPAKKVRLVDLGEMMQEEMAIETLIKNNNELGESARKYSKKVEDGLDDVESAVNNARKQRDAAIIQLQKATGVDDPGTFFQKYVIRGKAESLEALKSTVATKLGDTFEDASGITHNTEEALDRGITYMLVNGMMEYAEVGPIPGRKHINADGTESVLHAMDNPEKLVEALDMDNVRGILSGYLDEDHVDTLVETAQYLSESVALRRAELDTAVTIKGLVSKMGTNQLISRSFNLARGMVSPQYVAAEFGVSLASHAGIDMMKLAAGNEEAADLILRMMKYPKDMTKADLATFDSMVTEFVITELGALGEKGRSILDSYTATLQQDEED